MLASYLVPDRRFLRLTDRTGERRLTPDESERAARIAATRRARAERTAKEAVVQHAAEERAAKERAWAKLRELGVDPATLDDQ